MEKQLTGIINNILPKSFVDGPGNRAVVFMQGCNFHCLYCHNPFTINFCTNCGDCVDICPQDALRLEDDRVIWNQDICVACEACQRICPHFSTPRTRSLTPEGLWQEIKPIQAFITGISISGGEPSLQIPFLKKFFKLVKHESTLSTLIETNGYSGPQAYEVLLPYLDMAVVDLKSISIQQHEKLTAKPLKPVLETIRYMAVKDKLYAVNQVIIPGYTEDAEQVKQTAIFLVEIDPEIRLRLLRFRAHGTSGQAEDWPAPTDESMDRLVETARAAGLMNVERSL